MEENIPFTKLTNNEFDIFIKHGLNSILDIENTFTSSPTQQIMFDKLNNLINQNSYYTDCDEDDNDEVKSTNCYYYSTEEYKKAKFKPPTSFSIFHLNIHSIQLHIEELRILLEMLEYKFYIIAISESKLNNQPTVDINLTGYHTPYCKNTEANKCGTLLYVNKELNYKPRKDLCRIISK